MSNRMPEDMSDKMSENLSDKISEDILNRISENLSIRKYINAMVGIIRNEICFFYFDIY